VHPCGKLINVDVGDETRYDVSARALTSTPASFPSPDLVGEEGKRAREITNVLAPTKPSAKGAHQDFSDTLSTRRRSDALWLLYHH
jgi:hypothetical protein